MNQSLLQALLAIMLLSMMDAVVKELSASVAIAQIVFLRYLFGIATGLPITRTKPFLTMTGGRALKHGLRGLMICITATLFFMALNRLPLVEAVLIAFSAPLWIAVLARMVLGERLSARTVVSILLGFGGVLVVTSPAWLHTDANQQGDVVGYLCATGAALGYAVFTILVRSQAIKDDAATMVVAQAIAALVISAPFAVAQWQAISALQWALFLLVGSLGTAGHLLLTRALAKAPAATLAPAEFTGVIWAGLFGWLFFQEALTMLHLAGAVIIGFSCLMVMRQDRPALTAT